MKDKWIEKYNIRMKNKILLTPKVLKWFTDNGFTNYLQEWDEKNGWKGRVVAGWHDGCFYRIDNDIRIEIRWDHDYSCEEYSLWWEIRKGKITGKTKTKYISCCTTRKKDFGIMMEYIKKHSDEIIMLLKIDLAILSKSDIIYFTCTRMYKGDEHLFDGTKIYLD